MKNVTRLLDRLGRCKDGITVSLAILLVIVGFYQYFEFRSDRKIEASLKILERRESAVFVEARTKLLQTWFEADGNLIEEFAETYIYTDELYKEIDPKIRDDTEYRSAMLQISAYYSNAAACVLDGLCDQPTICSSLHGEIQDYLDINRNYFVYLRRLRQEDSVSLYLHHPEFVEDCGKSIMFSLFSRTDDTFRCRTARKLYRLTGIKISSLCSAMTSDYTKEIIRLAKEDTDLD